VSDALEAVFFDLDATLLDGSRFGESVLETCARVAAAHPHLDAERLLAANADAFRRYWSEIEAHWTLGRIDGASVGREAWRRTLQACGCDDERVLDLASATHTRLGAETYRLFADVHAAFVAIERARLPVALITNGAADSQREKLERLELTDRFDAVVISGEHGIAKPDPAIFAIAIDRLGARSDRVWHVGDNLATDVAGARASGIRAVWLNRAAARRKPADPEPDIEIVSLTELAALIGR